MVIFVAKMKKNHGRKMNQTGKDLKYPNRAVPYCDDSFFGVAEITDPFNFLFPFMISAAAFYEA